MQSPPSPTHPYSASQLSSSAQRRPNGSDDGSSTRSKEKRQRKKSLRLRHKHHEAHVPAFPNLLTSTSIVLDPAPNSTTRSVCIAVDVLVTAHRSGVRLYKERALTGCQYQGVGTALGTEREPTPGSSSRSQAGGCAWQSSGLWELKEFRDSYDLRDAYLCEAIQPVVLDDVLLSTPFSRYVCVATGHDRTTHSVCVFSTAAHFHLHHELHGKNKIVAMHFTQLALEPFQERRLTPFVLSIDETGEMVVFNVERDSAVKVRRLPCTPRLSGREEEEEGEGRGTDTRDSASTLEEKLATLVAAAGAPRGFGHDVADDAYHLEAGIATQAALVGPCVEMCNSCHNLFSDPARVRGRAAQSAGVGRLMAVSAIVSSRARDVVHDHETLSQEEGAAVPVNAELNVTFVRILLGASGAFAWRETELVREVAPVDVSDAGTALFALPYTPGSPVTVLLARPRLRLWQVGGCSGTVQRTLRVYDEEDGSGLGTRAADEFFVRWLPLGRHVVSLSGDSEVSWACVAAMTDDDTLLLLGQDPCDESAGAQAGPGVITDDRGCVERLVQERVKENQVLEAWLDDVQDAEECEQGRVVAGADTVNGVHSTQSADAVRRRLPPSSNKAFTVLLELYSPRSEQHTVDGSQRRGTASTKSKRRGAAGVRGSTGSSVQSVLADLPHSAVLLFFSGNETIVRVPLPFKSPLRSSQESDATRTSPPQAILAGPADGRNKSPSPAPRAPATATTSGTGLTASIWASTRKALTTTTAGIFHTGQSADAHRELPPPVALQTPANSESRYGLSIMRPLTAAVFRWGGGGESRTGSAAAAPPQAASTSPERGALPAGSSADTVDTGSTASRAQSGLQDEYEVAEVVTPPAQLTADSSLTPSSASDTPVSLRGSDYPRRVEAVLISVEKSHRRSSRRRSRTSRKPEGAASHRSEDASAGLALSAGGQDAMQRRYMLEQVQQTLARDERLASEQRSAPVDFQSLTHSSDARAKHLVDREEPTARNAVLFAWEDAHNQLYIEFSLGLESMRDAEAAKVAWERSENELDRALYQRFVLSDVAQGTRSAQFLHAYRKIRDDRRSLRIRKGIFDFSQCFATGKVPQQVLDLQERDKCQFELSDLSIKQAEELAALDPVGVVRLYRNEERAQEGCDSSSKVPARWRLHLTFPYDDEQGTVADIYAWNRTAGPATPGEWEWETDTSETVQSPTASRARATAKELTNWSLGPWQYASHWPSAEEAKSGNVSWSTQESADWQVRRRELLRRRINLSTKAAREQLFAEQQQQLAALRMELAM